MTASRGLRRRSELIDAGVGLLAEEGWSGVTQRAVAARANSNAGLVHYYFQGTPGLRLAVAERAAQESITALCDELLGCDDETALLALLAKSLARVRDDHRGARVISELVSAAFDNEEVRAVVRAEFARARTRVEHWLSEHHPSWSARRIRGSATALVALIDGIVLHLVVDPALPLTDITLALQSATPKINTKTERRNR